MTANESRRRIDQGRSTEDDQEPVVTEQASPYQSLRTDVDCTRLVKILPGNTEDAPIRCDLKEVAFGDRPKFEALSYMWGDDTTQSSIALNGREHQVGQNLKDALLYLRESSIETWYWIDALCINQDDVAERSRQVRLMPHIYFRATTVIVWLGTKYDKYEASVSHSLTSTTSDLSTEDIESPSIADNSTIANNGYTKQQLVKDLYNDGYWRRVWIIQEIGKAQNIKVCYGHHTPQNWHDFIHPIAMHNLGRDGPIKLNVLRQDRYSGGSTLLRLLHDHKDALCKDPKDKIYGLVGMASDASGFEIDYDRSLFEIWTNTLEFMNAHELFDGMDIAFVAELVKILLMGKHCDPLEQISRRYAPEPSPNPLQNDNDYKVFRLPAYILGCVQWVGPRPQEVVAKPSALNLWTRRVQQNYSDVGKAHQESDILIRTILDVDPTALSMKCFNHISSVRWVASTRDYDDEQSLSIYRLRIQELQAQPDERLKSDEQPSLDESPLDSMRLYQLRKFGSFGDSTPWKMGIASSEVRPGDLICWLERPRRAVVVRVHVDPGSHCRFKLQIMGTAVVTEDVDTFSFSSRHAERIGELRSDQKLTVCLDAKTLFILLA